MQTGISSLSQKGQTTIPIEIREELGLKEGDKLLFEIVNHNKILIKKLTPLDYEYHKSLEATLSEWNSEIDDEAYKDL